MKTIISANLGSNPQEKNFSKFVAELTKLTRKYGVAVKVTGGVLIADAPKDFKDVEYDNDFSSGDLHPLNLPKGY